jgi:hypothetical protein
MTFESQGKIAQTLITIILTALGTLMFQCAKYAFFDFQHDFDQFDQKVQYDLKRQDTIEQNYSGFIDALRLVLDRTVKRVDKLSVIKHLESFDLKKMDEVHSEAAQYAIEANSDYSWLQSFAVDDKLLTQPIRDTLAKEVTEDAESWQVLLRCSRPGVTQREVISCNDDLTRAKFGIHGAVRHDQLSFNESMMQIDLERERQQYISTGQQMRRSLIASMIGVIASLIAYYIILTRIVIPGALTPKLDAQTEQKGAISEDKQAGNTNLNKDAQSSGESS